MYKDMPAHTARKSCSAARNAERENFTTACISVYPQERTFRTAKDAHFALLRCLRVRWETCRVLGAGDDPGAWLRHSRFDRNIDRRRRRHWPESTQRWAKCSGRYPICRPVSTRNGVPSRAVALACNDSIRPCPVAGDACAGATASTVFTCASATSSEWSNSGCRSTQFSHAVSV